MTLSEEFENEVRKSSNSGLEMYFGTDPQNYINWLEAKINEFILNENNYMGADKARKISSESLKKKISEEFDTKQVLEKIEVASHNGCFEIETYDDEKIRKNLTMLGYSCSEPFKGWGDVYMKVTWDK